MQLGIRRGRVIVSVRDFEPCFDPQSLRNGYGGVPFGQGTLLVCLPKYHNERNITVDAM